MSQISNPGYLNSTLLTQKLALITCIFFTVTVSCLKKTADTPAAMIPEQLKITPENESTGIGGTISYTAIYFNSLGEEASLPNGISWSVTNPAIATITQQGVATGVSPGQTVISVNYKNITATALLSVVSDDNQVAFVEIVPAVIELSLTQTFALTATVKNINGDIIDGKILTWETDSAIYADVDPGSGVVTATGHGTAHIIASTDGIQSPPAMVQVIRKGNFTGNGSAGSAKLKINNNVLVLETSSDFQVSAAPPDLRIYLGNRNDNIDGSVEIATLDNRNGLQSWNLPSSVPIGQYRYVIVWCKQFGGIYGVADLGN